MIQRIRIQSPGGAGKTGYSVKIFAYSSGSTSGYSGAAIYTLTDANNGNYYADVTTTIRGTVVITASGSTIVIVPAEHKGRLFWGDNVPTLGYDSGY